MKKRLALTIVLAFIVSILAISASAKVSLEYKIEETTDSNTGTVAMYQIVATLYDTESDFRAFEQNITFDNNIIIPVSKKTGKTANISTSTALQTPLDTYSYSYYDENTEEDVTVTGTYPSDGVLWTANGANSTLETKVYVVPNNYPANGVTVFELHFVLADGYTLDDFTSETFKVDYIKYTTNEFFYYGHSDSSMDNIEIDLSNVVPEAVAITVPVAAGDIVYLQDGTFATAAVAGDYEVPATTGYVVVNTGKTAQVTYYVDGTTATAVHENGVLGQDTVNLRDRTAAVDTQGNTLGDRNGLRYKMLHNPGSRTVEGHEVTEVGFIMTAESNKVISAEGADYVLDMEMVYRGYAKSNYAYNKAEGRNWAQDTTDDEAWDIRAVFYNIPITTAGVQTVIASRPYYKVGGTYVYGEITKTTLYDTAKSIKDNADAWENCTESMQQYIMEVLFQVDGTAIVEDEVIIDIGSLYE